MDRPSDIVLTCLFTAHPDPQSGQHWRPDPANVSVLSSLAEHEVHTVVLHDQPLDPTPSPSEHVTWRRVNTHGLPNAYWSRWVFYADLLAQWDWVERVWCIDANDVVCLNDPFTDLEPGTLHIGSEPTEGPNARSLSFWWMTALHPEHADWLAGRPDEMLLNCGLVGGDRSTVRTFAEAMERGWPTEDKTDMARANRVAREDLPGYSTGEWHTPMWSFATSHPTARWAHK